MSDSHKTIQYNLRMTEELREKLKKSAKSHNRTMNQDIIARIEQTFSPQTINLEGQGIAPKQESDLQAEVRSLSEQLDEMMNITTNMYKAYYFAVESNPNIPYEQKQQLTEPKNLDLSKKAP